MTLDGALTRVTALGDARLGDLRKLAKELGPDHDLGLALWDTPVRNARLVAILLLKPGRLSKSQVDGMTRAAGCTQVADWLLSNVTRKHAAREALRELWLQDAEPWAARAGWSLTYDRLCKQPEGIDAAALLERIATEAPASPREVQWTQNFCLAGIGIHVPALRERAVALGHSLGLFKDYPVPKGCTSPFAPLWIAEMVRRQGN